MKRTWVVTVEPGVGHEYHNTTSETEFYGPFTELQAEKLAAKLNALFAKDPDEERLQAGVFPLDSRPWTQILMHYRTAQANYPHDSEHDDACDR